MRKDPSLLLDEYRFALRLEFRKYQTTVLIKQKQSSKSSAQKACFKKSGRGGVGVGGGGVVREMYMKDTLLQMKNTDFL